LSNATAQNAAEGSGLSGGTAQIAGQAGSNIQGINQGQSIGLQMFQANAQASRGATLQSIGQGISGLGDWMSNNYEMNRRVYGFG
jgi:hypothetical protein